MATSPDIKTFSSPVQQVEKVSYTEPFVDRRARQFGTVIHRCDDVGR
jgi:hypothetical protein